MPETSSLPVTDRTRLRRFPENGSHQRQDLYRILDAAWTCHLGVVVDGYPMVVPTSYGRAGDRLYVHGSAASRSLRTARRQPICVTVTLVDGIVIARSLFNHSVNYRCAMAFGVAQVVDSDAKLNALRIISDHVVPGQWDYARPPSPRELAQTTVLELALDEASVKVSEGPPDDGDGPDGPSSCWAGVIPVAVVASAPVADPALRNEISLPDHLTQVANGMAARMAAVDPRHGASDHGATGHGPTGR